MDPAPERPADDTYIVWRSIENFGAQGGEGEFWLAPLPPHEVVEAKVFFYVGDIAGERLLSLTLSGLTLVGDDSAALADAQAALEIPAPVDPGDIDHNTLGGLQGGNGTDEFYHLTAAEHTNVGNLDTAAYEPTTSFDAAGTAAAAITAHEGDATAHPASSIVNTPAGGIAATDVQAALNELDTDKEAAGAAAAAISAHESDTTAHPASSIVFTPVGTIAATDAQTAIAEVATDAAAALASEASTRGTADTTLQGNIDDEATARATADSNHVAAADPHTQYQKESEKDVASGYCGLDANSLIAHSRLQIAARLLRVLPIGMGTTGWSTITTGTPGTFYTNSPQYDPDQRVATIFQAHVVDVGSTTTGTNAICAYQNAGALHYLTTDLRIVWHGLIVNAGNVASARVLFIANGASAAATGRPAYGIWLEYNPTTLGNSNWWACCANGGSVSTADTGVAANNTERVWVVEFESTTSCKFWELVTSTSSARATLTSQLPSGTTAQTGRLALQAQRITGGSGNGKLMTINGDFGLVLPSYGIDKAWPA